LKVGTEYISRFVQVNYGASKSVVLIPSFEEGEAAPINWRNDTLESARPGRSDYTIAGQTDLPRCALFRR